MVGSLGCAVCATDKIGEKLPEGALRVSICEFT